MSGVVLLRLPPFMGYSTRHPRDVTLPLTLASIATLARRQGWIPHVRDLWARMQTMQSLVDDLRALRPRAVVFEADAGAYPVVLRCADLLRKSVDAPLVALGSVPTFLPERVVGPGLPFDVAIRGEAELTAAELLSAFALGTPLSQVEGLAYWDGGSVVRTPDRPELQDLDQLPMIDYAPFQLDRYHKFSFPVPSYRRVRWGYLLATRGCPYPCTHCSMDHRQSVGRRLRMHSPSRVVDNMERLVEGHGVNAISIEDDIFTLRRRYVLDICDEIEARGLRVRWIAQTRVDCIDRPLLRRMKRAGCIGLSLGIESGSDRVLRVLRKGFTKVQVLDGLALCREEGLMLRLLFMIGNPTETAEEIAETMSVACQAAAITIQVHITTPYPGTGIWGDAEGDGSTDFSSYNRIVRNLSRVPDHELWQLQKRFYRTYYLSRRYMALFARQRGRFLLGSWRSDFGMILRAAWFVAKASGRQGTRSVDQLFGPEGDRKDAVLARRSSGAVRP